MPDQEHISQFLVGPTYRNPETKETYHEKGPFDHQRDRVNQVSRADDTYKNYSVGLRDLDDAFLFYFREVIRPTVTADGQSFAVPIVYGNPEKWKAVQKDGFYRDKNGKRQVPVVVFKRTNLKKIRTAGNKLDANRPHNFYVTSKAYSRRNPSEFFQNVQNRVPEWEFVATVIPDFVQLDYNVSIVTDYMEQMNPIVESISFVSDAYWGRKDKFRFQAFVSDIKTEVKGEGSEDRTVKSDFSVKLNGYIVPQTVLTNPYVNIKGRNLTTTRISFQEKTITDSRELEKVL